MSNEKPSVQWPKAGEHKFVQLQIDDRDRIVFGPTGRYHGDILGDQLRAEGVQFKPFSESKDYPVARGERYVIVGAGLVKVDEERRRLTFFGDSFDYQLKPNREQLDKIEKPGPEWEYVFY